MRVYSCNFCLVFGSLGFLGSLGSLEISEPPGTIGSFGSLGHLSVLVGVAAAVASGSGHFASRATAASSILCCRNPFSLSYIF